MLISAFNQVEVEVEAELGNIYIIQSWSIFVGHPVLGANVLGDSKYPRWKGWDPGELF